MHVLTKLETVDFDAPTTEAVLRACLLADEQLRWRVRGVCMQPRLREGAEIVLVSVSRRPARWGDVVLVRQAAGLRLHRLVWPLWPTRARLGAASRRLRTMADRARAVDPALGDQDLLAVVVQVEHDAGGQAARARWLSARLLLRALMTGLATRIGLRRASPAPTTQRWQRAAARA